MEPPLIRAALAATRGNQIKAAALLGVNRNTLRSKIRAHNIRVLPIAPLLGEAIARTAEEQSVSSLFY